MAGELLPRYKQALVEDLVQSIAGNTSIYYAFASNPTENLGAAPNTTVDDYSAAYENGWNLLFGKKIANTDVSAIIKRYDWQANTKYLAYDDKQSFANTGNSSFYVSVPPSAPGGYYHIYKCIDNASNGYSTQVPDLRETYSFTLSDGYTWRYIYSISSSNYAKFATDDYLPVYPNNSLTAAAYNYSGVDKILVTNVGSDYRTYHDGTVLSAVNTTLIQISNTASGDNDFYTDSSIYIYTVGSPTAQLRKINSYVANSTGKWCYVNGEINIDYIVEETTQYKISPTVTIDSDGNQMPLAYSVVNSISNTIANVVLIESGYGITRAEVTITANAAYGTGATARCIVPPPGGHGSNPASELYTVGMCITSSFVETESNTIITKVGNTSVSANLTYNKIGIIKDPYELYGVGEKGTVQFSSNTFDQIFKADLNPDLVTALDKDTIVIGQTSGAKGKVVFSNTSQIYLVGDKHFINNEEILHVDTSATANINITHRGDIYAKDFRPIYVENVNDIERADDQSETFKIIIRA